ncbi:hypothetical protein E4T48_05582 [Aureobasidium sp. EXF-10727]|nr:hypothetical protein E4T48_05582 [Aureobasidium sp. EXF-10727]
MYSSISFSLAVSLVTLVTCASASPLASTPAIPGCSARDIAIVRRTVSDETYFCKWWLSDTRTKSPFFEFAPAEVTNLCKCIVSVPTTKTTTKQKRAESTASSELQKRQTVASCRAEMSVQFTEPYNFCVFYNSYPRTTSPFAKYSAKDLIQLCNFNQTLIEDLNTIVIKLDLKIIVEDSINIFVYHLIQSLIKDLIHVLNQVFNQVFIQILVTVLIKVVCPDIIEAANDFDKQLQLGFHIQGSNDKCPGFFVCFEVIHRQCFSFACLEVIYGTRVFLVSPEDDYNTCI